MAGAVLGPGTLVIVASTDIGGQHFDLLTSRIG